MDPVAYASAVRFRLVQPDTPLTPWVLRLRGLAARAGREFDVAITRLPEQRREMRARLAELCRIPRMSTYAVGAIINRIVAGLPADQAFVNVGVWNGFTLLAGMAGNPDRRCIGVDNFSEFGGPREQFLARFTARKSARHEFHDHDYRAYFGGVHRGAIGFYIYDGDHAYAHQLRGLEAAEPFLAPGALILVDDTNDPEPRQATLDFVAARAADYAVVFERRTAANLHPTFWNGVMLLRKRG
jgi:hypothetical protein